MKSDSVHPACRLSRKKNPTGRSLFFTQDLRQNISEPRHTGPSGRSGDHRKSLSLMAICHSVTLHPTFKDQIPHRKHTEQISRAQ
jgi:hypothetical protein